MTNPPRPARQYTTDYLLYGIGSIARQLSSVVMVPVYTHVLSPSDYGAVEIVNLLTGALTLIAGMNLGEGIFRFYHSKESGTNGNKTISTALTLAIGFNLAGAALLTGLAPTLAKAFIAGSYSWTLIAVASATLVTEACISIVTCHMRAQGDARKFFITGMLRLGLQIGINILLLVHFRMGAMGMVLGGFLSTLVVALCILPYTLRRISFRFSTTSAWSLVSFGAPLVVANVANFYFQSSDRFFLGRFHGLAEVGIYALAVRLSQAYVSLIHDPFEQIWEPEKYRIWSVSQDTEPFRRVFRLVTAVLVFCGTSISVFAAEIFVVLAPRSFAGASSIAPVMIAAALFTALVRFCRFGSLIANRTKNIWRAAWISVIVMTFLLSILVPIYGAIGAAAAVAATAMVRLIIEERLARRFVNLELPWRNFIILLSVGALIVMGGTWIPASTAIGVLSKLALLLLFAAGIWFSKCIAANDKTFVIGLIRGMRRSEATVRASV